jgi:hypothetical protein
MSEADKYAGFLERLGDSHQQRITQFLQVTENDLANYLQTAPSTDGAMFDVEWAINARAEMRRILEEDYLEEVQDMLGDYNAVARRQLKMLNNFGKFTRVSPEAIAGLQQLSFQGFEALADQQLETLANGVYQSALTGRNKDDFIQEVRGQINGIYQASDQEEIRQLVEVAQNSTGAAQQAAVDRLHRVYASDRLGNNLRRYATGYATDSLNQYSATLTVTTANEQGIDTFEYYGDVIRDSREFCKKHVGKEYTADEIRKIWEGSCCRHQWLPIVEPKDKTEEPETKEIPTERPIPIRKKSAVKKTVSVQAEEAAQDLRYLKTEDGLPATRFRPSGVRRNAKQKQIESFGKAALPASLSDDGASLLEDLIAVGNGLADKYKLPRLRGTRSVGGRSANMSMGDGMLSFKPDYVNRTAAQLIGPASDAAEKIAKDKARLEILSSELAQEAIVVNEAIDFAKGLKFGTKAYDNAYKEAKTLTTAYNKKVDASNRLERKIAKESEPVQPLKPQSTWAVGDDLSERPFGADEYLSDPLSRIKNTVTHEMAHHIHQQYAVKTLADLQAPRIEGVLSNLWRKYRSDKISPSKYADTNPKEWFAESFSLYEAGRKDLIDPRLERLIDLIADQTPIEEIEQIMGKI